jgi:prophage endopeptidase
VIALGLLAKSAGTGIVKFFTSLPWWFYLAAALLACGLYYGHVEHKAGVAEQAIETAKVAGERDAVSAEFKAYKEQIRIAIAAKLKANALREKADAAAFKLANDNLREQNEKSQRETNRTIAALRSGALQLRERFQCKTQSTDAGSEAAASAGGRDGETQGGLQNSDAEFFVSFAGEADEAVNQLNACQDILEAERVEVVAPDE